MIAPFIIPVLLTLTLGLVLLTGFCIYGYRSLKKQLHQLAMNSAEAASAPEKLAETAKQIDDFRSHVNETGRHKKIFQFDTDDAPKPTPPPTSIPAPVPNPGNPNRRGQVMRLHRSGESIPAIASALGVSQDEVKLMVKLHELLPENTSGETSPDFSNLGRNRRQGF